VYTKKNILVVEDEADLSELLCYNLQKEGYACRCLSDGASALTEVRRQPPDLLILDRMLPHQSGDEVATAMQRESRTADVPIIMLTAKAEEADELVGFALGAADYVTKPFSMRLLLARVAAALRRAASSPVEPEQRSAGPITLDLSRYEVTVDGLSVALTTTEFRILSTLMGANGRVLDRGKLIDLVLGSAVAVTDRTIDVHIASLRKKLGDRAAAWIQTVRGVGYTFREPHVPATD
jgi:two-component system phosphate regulon response regulator PhoB